ncbi:MAG TPA: hypothetical protein PK389_02930 [Gammaproteobacteria bacterium]|nr:hypothetical protein [Gammaproteobacteria bacterium]HQZ88369.1 hypothetical protein [Gammaproteobacteria bacterium]
MDTDLDKDITMRVRSLVEPSLETLQEYFETLVLKREITTPLQYLSETHRRGIANKFAKKSLQELEWMARKLDKSLL